MTENFRPTIIRNSAWEALRGKWGRSALAYLVLTACVSVIVSVLMIVPIVVGLIAGGTSGGGEEAVFAGMIVGYVLGLTVGVLASIPIGIGAMFLWLDVARGGDVVFDTLFEPFRRFFRYLGTYVVTCIYIFLWSLLLYVPGIVKAFAWSQTFFIMRENPGMRGREARRLSAAMMKGHKWHYFLLSLSFIGWILLGMLTFGIALFWIYPYIYTAYGEFHVRVKQDWEARAV